MQRTTRKAFDVSHPVGVYGDGPERKAVFDLSQTMGWVTSKLLMYEMYAPMARYKLYDPSPSGSTCGLSSCTKEREDPGGLEPPFPLEAGRACKNFYEG